MTYRHAHYRDAISGTEMIRFKILPENMRISGMNAYQVAIVKSLIGIAGDNELPTLW